MAISERLALLVTLDANGAIKSFNDLGKAADKNLSKADQKMDRLASGFKKAGAGMMATAGLASVALFKAGQAAANLEQSVGGTEAVFGKASGAIDDYAKKAATAAGLSESAFRTATTSIGGQLKGLGFTTKDAADQAVRLTQVAADLSATYGGTTAEAVAALGAAFRGEADPAERFNLFLNQTRVNAKAVELGLAASTSQVSAQAKAQATLALITEQSADAQGQFGREAGTAAGQMAIANAQFENAKAALGQSVAPIIGDVASGLASMAGGFQAANEASDGFLSKLATFGTIGLGAGGAVSFAVGELIEMRDTLAPLGGKLRNVEGGLTRLGKGLAGLGIAGAVFGLVQMGRELDGLKSNMSGLTGLFANLDAANRASLDEMLNLANAAGGLDDVIRQAAETSVPAAQRLLDYAAANGYTAGQTEELQKIIDDKRDADVAGAKEQAAYTAEVQQASGAVDGLTGSVDVQKEALDRATESMSLFKQGIEEAFGDLTLEEAADRRAQAFVDMADRFASAQDEVKAAQQRVDDLLSTKKADRSDTWASDLKAAQEDLKDAIADTSRELEGNSVAALQNREDIRGAVEDIAALIQAHRDEGASMEELQYLRDVEKANLQKTLEQMGFNREEIAKYVEALDKIPITKKTTVDVDTETATLKLRAWRDRMQREIDLNPFSIEVLQAEKFANGPRSVKGDGRAIGGPVTAGMGYRVNEYLGAGNGFEWFAPANGTISPSGPTSGTVVQQTNNFYNPVPEAPSESTRKLRRVAREVAA